MTKRTITFCDEATGEIREYVRYSARLDDFNRKFGPETEYRVVSSISGLLDLQPSRMAAVQEAAGNGLKPQDCGLGKLSNMMVCTHRLLNANGDVVCDAHAAMAVTGHKDLECLATASHQRLMAKVGFGGEIFDEDEDRDIAATAHRGTSGPDEGEDEPLGTATAESAPEPDAPPADAAKPQRPARKARKPSRAPEAPEPAEGAGQPDATQTQQDAEQASPAEAPARKPAPPKAEQPAPVAMVRQVQQLAQRAGEDTPEVTTLSEAQQAIKRLTRKAAGAQASS